MDSRCLPLLEFGHGAEKRCATREGWVANGVRDYLSRMTSMTRARVDALRIWLQMNHNASGRCFSFEPLTVHLHAQLRLFVLGSTFSLRRPCTN